MSSDPKHLSTSPANSASMASSITSERVDIREADKVFGQIIWSSGVGVSSSDKFVMELSNDGTNFAEISSKDMLASASGSIGIESGPTGASYARFKFKQATASAGTASIIITAKK